MSTDSKHLDKHEVEHQHAVEPVSRRGKRRGLAAHCKRWWWVHLIILCAGVILVTCLLMFVAVPKIAQNKINDAKLEIQGVNILQTESDSYTMEVNSTITTGGGIHANVDAFRGDLYLEGAEPYVPFASLNFPKTNADKHQIVNVSQRLEITDLEAFTKFNIWFYNNDTVTLTIKGKTKVKPAGIVRKYSVNFEKKIDVSAFNLFNGTTVTEGKILTELNDEGMNFVGKARIPNQSYYTLDVGNLTLTNFADDQDVGRLYINNFILHPGNNDVDITANLTQATLLSLIQQRPYCETGIIPFKLQGENVTNRGQHISYLADGLGSGNQTIPMDIKALIKASLNGIELPCKDDS